MFCWSAGCLSPWRWFWKERTACCFSNAGKGTGKESDFLAQTVIFVFSYQDDNKRHCCSLFSDKKHSFNPTFQTILLHSVVLPQIYPSMLVSPFPGFHVCYWIEKSTNRMHSRLSSFYRARLLVNTVPDCWPPVPRLLDNTEMLVSPRYGHMFSAWQVLVSQCTSLPHSPSWEMIPLFQAAELI